MKIALTTDTHFGVSNNTQNIHKRFLKKLKKESFDVLVHTGDIASHKQKQLYRSLVMFREALGDIPMLIVLGNHDCLDKETELLTKRGWLTYDQVSKTDQVLSINKAGFSEWTPINDIIIKKSEYIYTYSNTCVDMGITENHRIFCSKRNRDKTYSTLTYTTLPEMTKGRYRFPISSKNNLPDYNILDDEIRLLGWLLSDGSFSGSTCALYQSKITGRSDIRQLLKRLGYKFTSSIRKRTTKKICGKELKTEPMVSEEFYILSKDQKLIRSVINSGKIIKDKDIFNNFSTRQLLLFLKSLMSGDGSWAISKRAGALNGTLEFLSWVQILAAQCGVSASLVEYRDKNYRLNLSFNREFVQIDNFKGSIESKKYNAEVWCLNVPNTNFMVRRKGKSYFTGNCWDQDSWNKKNKHYNKKVTYEQMKITQREWFKELNIHYLQDSEYLYKDEVIFYGYDGWYYKLPPPTNDIHWMPPLAKCCPIDQYLRYRADKTLDAILMSIDGIKQNMPHLKVVCVTHHSLLSDKKEYEAFCGNPKHLDFLSENFDYVFYGHSHQELDIIHEYVWGNRVCTCRVLNVGSDYDLPKYRILEI